MWARALERVARTERGRVLAHLIRWCGDFQLAEDALQDALAAALETWPRDGVPDVPAAWLSTTARRRVLDRLRRDRTRARTSTRLKVETLLQKEGTGDPRATDGVSDERLRLIFTCCHPALSDEAQVALTLRTLGGMSTREIAKAFLVAEKTMAQRIVRAQNKISAAGIPFEVPGPRQWSERLDGVLRTVYLIFNEGYMVSHGETLVRRELTSEALRLGQVLFRLLPHEAEIEGLLALMILHESRSAARTDAHQGLVCLEAQDRTRWDSQLIDEGIRRITNALSRGPVGPYQVQAAIAAVHAEAPCFEATDWPQIALLYDTLYQMCPSPVVDLNRAVSYGMVEGPREGLRRIEGLPAIRSGGLQHYVAYHVARAYFLKRVGDNQGAQDAYAQAETLAENRAVQRFVRRQRDQGGH